MSELHAFTEDVQRSALLPPEDACLWNPVTQGKLDTPLDSRGLVDLSKLVLLGKQTVEEDYDWSSSFNDVHHLQWPAAFYRKHDDPVAVDFRELVQRKMYIPRTFHNWLHYITEPPPIPSEEVMQASIKAAKTARALAVTARLAVKLARMKEIPEAKRKLRLEQEFDNYSLYVENAREVPPEFQLLKLQEVEARDVSEMLAANKYLGGLALDQVRYRDKTCMFRKAKARLLYTPQEVGASVEIDDESRPAIINAPQLFEFL